MDEVAKNNVFWIIGTNYQMTLKIRELFRLVRFIRRRIYRRQRIEIAKQDMMNQFWKKLVNSMTQ